MNDMIDDAISAERKKQKESNKDREHKYILSVIILSAFTVVIAMVLYCSFGLLTGQIVIQDPGTIAMVAGLIGTLIGYMAGLASNVTGYWFGSSAGSSIKDKAIADAMSKPQ
jgi:hypothetical protein